MGSGWPRWVIPVLFAVLMLSFALPRVWPTSSTDKKSFSTFWSQVEDGEVKSVVVNNSTNSITGVLTTRREVHQHRAQQLPRRQSDA